MPHFTLYARSYCHLCDDMLAALQSLLDAQPAPPQRVDVTVIDIDAAAEQGDPGPLARYDELVPVLFGDLEGAPLCHYFLDEVAVRHWLASQ